MTNKGDIDSCFRVGKTPGKRPLIVNFVKDSVKQELYRAKKQLRSSTEKIFVNEDLTKYRQALYAQGRSLRKEGFIWRIWTSDGRIYYTTGEKDKPKILNSMMDIEHIRKTVTARPPLPKDEPPHRPPPPATPGPSHQ